MYLKAELYELIKTDESIFDFIQESSIDGLWYWDLENPENEWMNARFWTVLGYHPDEMPHKSSAWQSIINQEDLKAANENFVKHCENPNHPYDQVVRYTHKDGSTRWIRCRGIAIRDANGKPIRMLGAHQDISGMKNSETALLNAKKKAKESEEKYRAIFENINDAVFIHKILHNGEPGNFLYTNNAASDLLGYTSDELKLLSPKELDDPESSGKYIPLVMKALIKDRKSKFEAVQIAKDGCKIDVEVNAVVTKIGDDDQIVSVCRDITEKKASQRIIAEKEQFLAAIYKGISHSIFVVNVLENGDFQYAGLNPQHEKVTGLTTDFIKGKKPEDVFPAEDAMNIRNRYTECVIRKQTIAYDECLPFKGKQTYWETILNPQINETGNVFQIIGTSQDISERKYSEKLVEKKNEEIAAQNEELNMAIKALISAKEKAEENEKLFKSVIENAPDGVVIINEQGVFKYISPNAERLFGYNTDEAIGHSGDEYTHPDDLPMVLKAIERILVDPGQKPKLEYRFKRKTGEYRWIETTFTNLLSDKTISGIVLNFADITERKQIFEELLIAKDKTEASEERFNLAMKASNDGLFDWNLETNEIYYSPGWKKMLGYEDHELPNDFSVWENTTDPEDVKKSWELQQKLINKQIDRFVMEFKMKHKDGHWIDILSRAEAFFNSEGKAVRMVGTHTDITERKQAEAALKNRENLLNKVFDILPIGLWFADKNGKLIRGNPAGVKIWGAEPTVSIDEYGVFKARRLPSEKEIEADDWALAHTIRSGVTIEDEELEIDAFDGQKKIILNYTAPVFDEEGNIQGAIVVNQDITARKKAELLLQEKSEEIAAQNEELNQANAELIKAKEKAEENEKRFRNALDNSPIPIGIAGVNGALVYMNKQFIQTYGYTIQDIPTIEKWYEQAYPDPDYRKASLEDWNKEVEQSMKNGVPTRVKEYKVTCKNGEVKTVAVSGYFEKDLIVGLFQDITERKKAEEEYLKFFTITEKALYGSAIADPDGNIVYVNDYFAQIHGYAIKELQGRKINIFHSHAQMHLVRKTINEALKNGNIEAVEIPHCHKNGQEFPMLMSFAVINDALGKPKYIAATAFDLTEQKSVQQKLQNTINDQNILLHNDPTLIYFKDCNNNIIRVTESVAKATGLSREQIEGRHSKEIYPNMANQYWEDDLEVIQTGKPKHNIVEPLISIDGTNRWLLTTKVPVKNHSGETEGICVFATDITNLKKAQIDLQKAKEIAEKSEERYALAIDASEQGIWDWNIETNEVFYSKQWKRQIGYDDHEIENNFVTWVEHLHPDEKTACQNAVQDYLNNPTEHFILTFRFRHKDGSYRWIHNKASSKINNEGKVVRMFGTHTDISERKHAEIQIKNISRRLQLSTESANIGIWELDLKHNQLNWDKRMFELYGIAHDGFIGAYETWKNGVHPEDVERADAEVQEAISGKKEFHTQFRVVWPNGEIRFLEAHAIVTRDPEGNPESMIGINWDITDKKAAENNLIKAKEKAEESDRLKSAFLANMSHEIRTPMNGILGFADLLKAPDLTGDQQQKYIGIIEKSGVRMLNIIDQIVDISKIEAGLMTSDIKETNINEQIEYICTFFKPEAEAKGINLSYNNTLTNNEAVIQTDREKVYAILTNLVKNAIKYTKKGAIELGYVLTDTTNKPVEPTGSELLDQNITPELRFYVKDTGIGIPKNRQEAIFERFIQADIEDRMAYQGAGLGLAITKAYVEMLDGNVWVESIEGEGSTFYFTLPYITRSIKNPAETTPLTSESYNENRKLKILIAEDEEISQMLIDNFIKNFGKEIFKARTGLEAVEICRANPDIDLILMDIRMPYMDGYEATKQIRAFNKDVIIIAQTAYGLTGDREKAIKSGCNDYITKPIKKMELLQLIQNRLRSKGYGKN